MADNVNITPGTGNVVAADEVTDGTLGTVKVQYTKLMDGTIDGTNKLVVSAAGAAKVDGSAVTQPISGTVTANIGTSGSLALDTSVTALQVSQGSTTSGEKGTLIQGAVTTAAPSYTTAQTSPLSLTPSGALRTDASATTQPISGTVTAVQATGTNLHTVLDSGTLTSITNALPAGTNVIGHVIADSGSTTAVTGNVTVVQPTGTNLHVVVDTAPTTAVTQSTSPWVDNVSQFGGSNVVTGTGASGAGIPRVTISNDSSLAANQSVNNAQVAGTAVSVGNGNTDSGTQRVTIAEDSLGQVEVVPSVLSVTAVGASGAAVTATLPAVASSFHYITGLEIEAYTTAARTGAATPVTVTSTNLPGSNAWTFSTAAAIGTTDTKWYQTAGPIRSSVTNTATTIVCPATTSIIWRVNVYYYAAE